jgi:hypothetical protein
MKKIYTDNLKAIAQECVLQELPGFNSIKLNSALIKGYSIPKKLILFEKQFERLAFYLAFYPDKKNDRINLMIGWSEKKLFPAESWQFPHSNIKDNYLEIGEFLANYWAVTYYLGMGNHSGWNLWMCSIEPPSIDSDAASNSDEKKDYNEKYQVYKAAYVAESLAPVSNEKAILQVKNAFMNCMKDIHQYVMPIFERKLRHLGEEER